MSRRRAGVARLSQRQRAHLASTIRDASQAFEQGRRRPLAALRSIQNVAEAARQLSGDELLALAETVGDIAAAHPHIDGNVAHALEGAMLGGFDPARLSLLTNSLRGIPTTALGEILEETLAELEGREKLATVADEDSPAAGGAGLEEQHDGDGREVENSSDRNDGQDEVGVDRVDQVQVDQVRVGQGVSGAAGTAEGTRPTTTPAATHVDPDGNPVVMDEEPVVARLRESFGQVAARKLPVEPEVPEAPQTTPAQGNGGVWQRISELRERLDAGETIEDVDAVVGEFPPGWQRREAVTLLLDAGIIDRAQARNIDGLGPFGPAFL